MTAQTEPIRKSLLPCIPPPEWEFHTVHGARTSSEGCALFPGGTGLVVVRRRVTYGDWEPVRPNRWADEPPTDAAAGVAPATDEAERSDRYAAAMYKAEYPGFSWGQAHDTDREQALERAEAAEAVADAEQAHLREVLAATRATNRRLNRRAQALESELATYRRAVDQWEISERGTYVPLRTLAAIAKAAGRNIETPQWLLHYQRVEQAEAAIERVRDACDRLRRASVLADGQPHTDRERGVIQAITRILTALDDTVPPAAVPAVDRADACSGCRYVPCGNCPPTDWIDGHPHLEAIAAAVWEQCERHDSGLVIDDPRNIAVAALAAVLPDTSRAAVLLWAADQIDAETRQAKADGVLEPDKFRPCRDASAQLRALAGCQECASGVEHSTHCPTPETHNWGCGCPTDPVPADGPRRMADGEQQGDTETEAHPESDPNDPPMRARKRSDYWKRTVERLEEERDRLLFVCEENDRRFRRMAARLDELLAENTRLATAGEPQAEEAVPVQHAPGKVVLCPDCHAKGYSACMDGGPS